MTVREGTEVEDLERLQKGKKTKQNIEVEREKRENVSYVAYDFLGVFGDQGVLHPRAAWKGLFNMRHMLHPPQSP